MSSASISLAQLPVTASATSGSTCAAAFANNTTTGNSIWVAVTGYDGSTLRTVSSISISTGSGTWTKQVSQAGLASTYGSAELWAAPNITGGTTPTVTAHFSGAITGADIFVFEFNGLPSSITLDGTASGVAGTGSTTMHAPSITTTGINDLVFAIFSPGAGTISGCSLPGYVVGGNSGMWVTWGMANAPLTSYQASATQNSASTYAAVICAVKGSTRTNPSVLVPDNMVQHVSFSGNYPWTTNTQSSSTGNAFKFPLPNPSLSGNLLHCEISYPSSAGTLTLSDNKSNTWSLGASKTAGSTITAIYYVANATTGTQLVTATFTTAVKSVTADLGEFCHIATSSPVDTSSVNNTSSTTSITAGSMTPGQSGDLIIHYGFDTSNTSLSSSVITNIASGSGFTLLGADIYLGKFVQYWNYASTSSINPTATITGGTDSFNSVAVAFKADNTKGTARATSGPIIIRVIHQIVYRSGLNTQVPCIGDALILTAAEATGGPAGPSPFTPLSDSLGNSYSFAGGNVLAYYGATNQGYPQIYISKNSASSPNMTMFIGDIPTSSQALNTGDEDPPSIVFYDVANLSSNVYDQAITIATNTSQATGNFNLGTVTPPVSGGLVISVCATSAGVITAGPGTNEIFDAAVYTGELPTDLLDNADGYAHYYNANTSSYTFEWTEAYATSDNYVTTAAFAPGVRLSGTCTGHSSNSCTLTVSSQNALSGTISGHSDNSCSLKQTNKLTSTVAGHSGNTASLSQTNKLTSTVAGHSANTGNLTQTNKLSSSASGHAANSSSLSAQINHLAGTISGHSANMAALIQINHASGTIGGIAANTSILKQTNRLISSVSGHASNSGSIMVTKHLVGTASGHSANHSTLSTGTGTVWASNGAQTGGSGSYVAGTQSVNYILANFAKSGDTITLPSGTFSWTGTTTINISVTLKGLGGAFDGTGSSTTIIEDNNASGTMLYANSGNDGHITICGIYFMVVANIGGGAGWCVEMNRDDSTAYTVLFHDNTVDNGTNNIFSFTVLVDAMGIILWNCYFYGNASQSASGGTDFVGLCGLHVYGEKYGATNAPLGPGGQLLGWNAPSTMGALDTTGLLNTYVENCTFENAPSGCCDAGDNARLVIRHCTFTNAAGLAHSQDTGEYGARHFEYYNNTFSNSSAALSGNYATSTFLNVRGGTFVFYGNTVGVPGYGGSDTSMNMTTQNINRGGSVGGCQVGYPVNRQVGQGWSSSSSNTSGNPVVSANGTGQVLEPAYIWGNSGAGSIAGGYSGEYGILLYYPGQSDACGNGLLGSVQFTGNATSGSNVISNIDFSGTFAGEPIEPGGGSPGSIQAGMGLFDTTAGTTNNSGTYFHQGLTISAVNVSAQTVTLSGSALANGTGITLATGWITQGVDFIYGIAKPGYSAFQYPHPLTTGLTTNALSGDASGKSSNSGNLTQTNKTKGTISGRSTNISSLSAVKSLSGSALASAANSSILGKAVALDGYATAASINASSLRVVRNFGGTCSGRSANMGALTVTRRMSGAASGHSANSCSLKSYINIVGSCSGHSANVGTLNVNKTLQGACSGHSANIGAFFVVKPLSGNAAGKGNGFSRIITTTKGPKNGMRLQMLIQDLRSAVIKILAQ